jgi:hypothetical protein
MLDIQNSFLQNCVHFSGSQTYCHPNSKPLVLCHVEGCDGASRVRRPVEGHHKGADGKDKYGGVHMTRVVTGPIMTMTGKEENED